jgi:malonyl CoA-acyl carrier protein transacylase
MQEAQRLVMRGAAALHVPGLRCTNDAASEPSQGAQSVGMGKDLVAEVPAAKALFDKAAEILGYDLLKVGRGRRGSGKRAIRGAGMGAKLYTGGLVGRRLYGWGWGVPLVHTTTIGSRCLKAEQAPVSQANHR